MDHNKRVVELPLEDVLPNRFQPRIKFNEESIIELSESIKEHGVIQPIVVRPVGDKYEIIAGERRYKASSMAGLATIPALITDLNDKDSAEVALIENVQRKDLTPIEEAISYKKILDMGYLTQEKLADKLGKKQSTVANKLRLLNLDEDVQEALLEDKISERHARSLLKLSKADDQKKILKKIIEERLTVRKTDEEINNMLNSNQSSENDILIENHEEKVVPTPIEEVPFDFSKLDFLPLGDNVEQKEEQINIDEIPKFEDLLKEEPIINPIIEETKPLENTEENDYENIFYKMLKNDIKDEEQEPSFDVLPKEKTVEENIIEPPTPFVFSDLFIEDPIQKENFNSDVNNIDDVEPIEYIDSIEEEEIPTVEPMVNEVNELPTVNPVEESLVNLNDEEKPFNFSEIEENDIVEENKKIETYVANDIKTVVNTVHNCAETIKKYGFNVEIDEIELNDEYRVTFVIKK